MVTYLAITGLQIQFSIVVFPNVMKTKWDPFKMEITIFQKCWHTDNIIKHPIFMSNLEHVCVHFPACI